MLGSVCVCGLVVTVGDFSPPATQNADLISHRRLPRLLAKKKSACDGGRDGAVGWGGGV